MKSTWRQTGNVHLEYKRGVNSAYFTFTPTSRVLTYPIEVHSLYSRHLAFHNHTLNRPTTGVTLATAGAVL